MFYRQNDIYFSHMLTAIVFKTVQIETEIL